MVRYEQEGSEQDCVLDIKSEKPKGFIVCGMDRQRDLRFMDIGLVDLSTRHKAVGRLCGTGRTVDSTGWLN